MSDIHLVDLQLTAGNDRACVYETDDVQIMRVRLAPGEALPHHNSNSNVLLTPLEGAVRFEGGKTTEVFGVGQGLSVPFDTPMDVSNGTDGATTFLVIKTPHPRKMK